LPNPPLLPATLPQDGSWFPSGGSATRSDIKAPPSDNVRRTAPIDTDL
jgi:hypothetical protein